MYLFNQFHMYLFNQFHNPSLPEEKSGILRAPDSRVTLYSETSLSSLWRSYYQISSYVTLRILIIHYWEMSTNEEGPIHLLYRKLIDEVMKIQQGRQYSSGPRLQALMLDSQSPNPCSTTYCCVTFSKCLNFSLLHSIICNIITPILHSTNKCMQSTKVQRLMPSS